MNGRALNVNDLAGWSLDILAEVLRFQNLPHEPQSVDSAHFAEVSLQSLAAQSGESCLKAERILKGS